VKIPGAYDLTKQKLVTRIRQSGTEDYFKNNRTRRRTTPRRLGTRARQAESEAFAEYSRILRAFTELTVNGKVPEERSEDGSDRL